MTSLDSGQQFYADTQFNKISVSAQEQGQPEPPAFPCPAGRGIDLPPVTSLKLPARSLRQCLDERRSHRRYSDKFISAGDLALLLHYCHGIQPGSNGRRRTVPSAGARYPFDCYVLCRRVSSIPADLYIYAPQFHQLFPHRHNIKSISRLVEACLQQRFVADAAAVLFWVAVPERTTWRYSERGYRYLWLDAGHIAQNLYLSCQLVNCGCCAIAAFIDDYINHLLNLPDGQACYYLATVGRVAGDVSCS
ncbi:MAG: SagB/ThcOx family dehydrogenase [Negativicutes bacterium]|nr:SagB/ThcOx family dehydrogenase [Negativicutes bacterium]